jgi:hypothetical protein
LRSSLGPRGFPSGFSIVMTCSEIEYASWPLADQLEKINKIGSDEFTYGPPDPCLTLEPSADSSD